MPSSTLLSLEHRTTSEKGYIKVNSDKLFTHPKLASIPDRVKRRIS